MGDGHILKSNIELGGTAGEVGADSLGDGFTLSDELGGVKLSDDSFEDFVTDGRQNTLIVIGTEILSSVKPCLNVKTLHDILPGKSLEEQ